MRATAAVPSVEHFRGTSKRIISMENNTLTEKRGSFRSPKARCRLGGGCEREHVPLGICSVYPLRHESTIGRPPDPKHLPRALGERRSPHRPRTPARAARSLRRRRPNGAGISDLARGIGGESGLRGACRRGADGRATARRGDRGRHGQRPGGAGRAARGSPSNALGHGNRRAAPAVAGAAPIRRRDSQTPRPGHATDRRTPRRSTAIDATGVTSPTRTPRDPAKRSPPPRVVQPHRRRRDHSRGTPRTTFCHVRDAASSEPKRSAHPSPTLPPSPALRNAKGRGTKSLSQE